MDNVSKETRSRIMASVRQRGTTAELAVRKLLHSGGFRFRLHRASLPGTPDLVLPKYRVAIFVHGCFWHYHQKCRYARLPASNQKFWEEKLKANVARDASQRATLIEDGWRVLVVWECATRRNTAALLKAMSDWITHLNRSERTREISGMDLPPKPPATRSGADP